MKLSWSAGGVFVLNGNTASDRSNPAVARPLWRKSGERTCAGMALAVAEPLDRIPGDSDIATAVTDLVCNALQPIPSTSVAEQISQGISEANDLVLAANRKRGSSRPLYLGLTIVVAFGHRLLICQLPPAQVILRDRRGLSCRPSLSSWTFDSLQDTALPLDGYPLGLIKEVCPRLITYQIQGGYEVAAVSSTVATALTSTEPHCLLARNCSLFHHIVRYGGSCAKSAGYGVGVAM